jgi:hypothetical protein
MNALSGVTAKVRSWSRGYQTVLLIDALATGAALTVMKSLIGIAYQQLGGQAPTIVALALNQVQPDRPGVTQLVLDGKIITLPQGSEASTQAQQKIYDKGYKEGTLGRLYPESPGGVEGTAPINLGALERMVTVLMSPENLKRI